MALLFRNIDASPDDPVEAWSQEGILTAVERGDLRDWTKLKRAIERDPWGEVADMVLLACAMTDHRGASEWNLLMVNHVRESAKDADRREVAADLRSIVDRSGLSDAAFAARTGTSGSRLSTYLSAKVCPSAAYMTRARRVADGDERTAPQVRQPTAE